MRRRSIIFIVAAVALAGCKDKAQEKAQAGGEGEKPAEREEQRAVAPERETIGFGKASAERKQQFVDAVAVALKSFEDLDSRGVQIVVATTNSVPQVTVRAEKIPPAELGKALAVALTNMSFRYPGIGFMATGDGGWKILMPDEMKIPLTGEFDLEIK